MRRIALRGLLAHKGRLVATFLAVALGVAFIGGVLTLTDTMNRSFDDLFADVYRGTDAVVRSDRTMTQYDEKARAKLEASTLEQVRSVPSVEVAEGGVEGSARIIDRDGEPIGSSMFGPPTLGGNWSDDPDLNPFQVREGRGPRSAGEIVIDAATAKSTGFEVGDRVKVQTNAGVGEYELVGIAGFGKVDSPAGASYVFFTTAEAQQLLSEPDRFDAVSVVARDGVSQAQVASDIRRALRADHVDDVEVLTGQQVTEESQSDLRGELSFVTNFFLVFAVVAVVVGSFVIYNSFSIIVAQRTREMALLRAIGASRRQVRRAVVVEAVAVGLMGSAIGFVLGLGIATGLKGLLDVDAGLAVLPTAVATAVGCGLVVTVLSALVPARRASKVPPVAAMRHVAVDRSGRSRVRFATGLAVGGLGVASVVAGATGGELQRVGLGLIGTLVGLLLAGPGVARPVSNALGWPVARLRGITGQLARANAGRNPRRSASTAQALMIGMGIVAFFMVVNTSIRASIDKTLDEDFAGDFIIDSGGLSGIGLPHELAVKLGELPEVASATPMRYDAAELKGRSQNLTATTSTAFGVFGLDVVQGSDALDLGEVVVLKETATKRHLQVGDTVTLDFLDSGPTRLRVAGIYDGPEASQLGSFILGIDELARHVENDSDYQIMITLADGTAPAEAKPVLDAVTKPYLSADVQTVDDYSKSIGDQLDVILNLVLGLTVLAIVIAMLGITNTVALSVLERTRELGLLRAVGMSRSQVRAAIRWESVIIALLGTSLGLAFGVLGGWGLVASLKDDGFEVFRVPFGTLTGMTALAAGLGTLAALLPAWRASRLNVLDAIEEA